MQEKSTSYLIATLFILFVLYVFQREYQQQGCSFHNLLTFNGANCNKSENMPSLEKEKGIPKSTNSTNDLLDKIVDASTD